MLNPKKIEEIAKQLSDNLPSGLKQAAADFEDKTKQILQQQLLKLDIASREEFEIQQHVLIKTREKLETLQGKVNELEELIKQSGK
ncbi:MAG: ubiquinone biosynthesis accessory factor UbiK [Shewanella sp.]